jgi:hypothetical protein
VYIDRREIMRVVASGYREGDEELIRETRRRVR